MRLLGRGDRSGSEPLQARSALGLRTVLAAFGMLFGLVAAAFAWWAMSGTAGTVLVAACLVLAGISAINLIAIQRRR